MNTPAALRVVVARRTLEAEGIRTYELVSADGQPLPAFSAGSHIDVTIPGGPERQYSRQYSLCNDPGEGHRYLIAVLEDEAGRGGSRAMHAWVREGDRLEIGRPRNHFALAHDARRSLLLAGGIGVTPLLCMAERLAITGADFEFHYCTRSPARTAFKARIGRSSFADRAHFHFDDGTPDQHLDLAAVLRQPEPGTHVYVCGPKGFMDAALGAARASGWPEAQLHFEFFGAPVEHARSDGSFEVELASSGRVVHVPADLSVVDALAAQGIVVATSCEQGVCGTCQTRVLAGEPEHRDLYLTAEEQASNESFMPCCSRSKSARLVLDL